MKKDYTRLLVIIFLFLFQFSSSRVSFGQWQPCGGPSGTGTYMLASDGTYLYATSIWEYFKVSSDNGSTWVTPTANGLPANSFMGTFTVSGGIFYTTAISSAGGNGDLYASYDHGATFTNLNNGYIFPAPQCILVSGNQFFLANTSGIEYSGDGGLTWSLVNSGLDNFDVKDLLILGSNVFAATPDGVFITSNNGASWSLTSQHHSIASFTTDGTTIYAAGDGVFESSNNGTSWTQISTGLPGNFACSKIILNNGYAFTCSSYNYYGVYATPVSSINWQEANTGLFSTSIKTLTAQGSDIFCGGFATLAKSTNNGNSWTPVSNGFTSVTIISMAVDSAIVYAGGAYTGIFRSDDYGNTWSPIDNGLPQNLSPVTCLTAENNLVFAGTYLDGVYRSINGGANWTHVFNGIDYCYTQAVAMKDNHVFMGTNDSGVYVSHDGGGSWARMNYGLPGYNIVSLTVNDTVIYAAVYGSGIFRSFDYGNSWLIVNTGLSSFNCTQLTSGGTNVYAAVGGKIYSSSNTSSIWTYLYGPIPVPYFGPQDIQYIGAQNNTVFGSPNSYGGLTEKFTAHSYDAGLTWAIDTLGTIPETIYCIIPVANTAFIGTGQRSVWCYNSIATGTATASINMQPNVFPNPSSGILNIELGESTNGNIIVTNLLGEAVLCRKIDESEKSFRVNLGNLPKGIYLYKIQNGHYNSSGKIILE